MSLLEPRVPFEKRRIAQHFNRAALSYQDHNHLQRDCADILRHEFNLIALPATPVLVDVGCGPGVASSFLAGRAAHYIGLDIAARMVGQAKAKHELMDFICADAEALPLAAQSVDCIYSNLTLQWCNALEQTLTELTEVLRPGGSLLATTVLAGSLEPLASAMRTVDGESHSNNFLSAASIRQMLARLPSVTATLEEYSFVYGYPTGRSIFNHLRGIGANYTARSEKGLRSRAWLTAIEAALDGYRKPDGEIHLIWNIGLIKLEKKSDEITKTQV